jgi:hypothetical protein
MKYEVTKKLVRKNIIEANSKKEAIQIAKDNPQLFLNQHSVEIEAEIVGDINNYKEVLNN